MCAHTLDINQWHKSSKDNLTTLKVCKLIIYRLGVYCEIRIHASIFQESEPQSDGIDHYPKYTILKASQVGFEPTILWLTVKSIRPLCYWDIN